MQEKTQPTLEEVQRQFEGWRRRKGRRDRIPKALWKAAVSLSGQHTTNEISKLLHLNRTAVRERIRAHKQQEAAPAFIEFEARLLQAIGECTIEMEKPGGVKMKICIKGNYSDIVGLSKALWGEA